MIKDTRYIIKRVIIGVLICLILSFIRTCEVKAETYTYYFNNTRLYYNDGGNNVKNSLPSTIRDNIYYYPSSDGYSVNTFKFRTNTNLSFSNISMVTFNSKITYQKITDVTNSVDIRSINFLDIPCYYTEEDYFAGTGTSAEYSKQISAICFYSGNKSITSGTDIVTISMGSVKLYQLAISNMNIINNDALAQSILTAIGTSNNRLLDINQNLTEINAEIYRIEGVVNAINRGITNSTNSITSNATENSQNEINAQNQTTDAVNDVNDTLNNSNVSINTMPSDNLSLGPISALVTLPITALNNIVSAFNGTCTPFNIGSLFGTNLVFPCIDIESFIGSFLWNTIDIIITGIYIFGIREKFIDLFYKLVTLKDIGLKGGF